MFFRAETLDFRAVGDNRPLWPFLIHGLFCYCTGTGTVAADDAAVVAAAASVQGVSGLRSSGRCDCLTLLVADAGWRGGKRRKMNKSESKLTGYQV